MSTTCSRFAQMRSYTQEISGELDILKQLNEELSGFKGKAYSSLPFALLEKRLSSSCVRSYFMRKVYEYFAIEGYTYKEDIRLFTIHLPFVWEVIIIIQYLQNQVYDGKSGVYHPKDIRNNVIVADKLKDLLYAYIEDYIPADTVIKSYLKKYAQKIFIHVNDGQAFESVYNSYRAFENHTFFQPKFQEIKEHIPTEIQKLLSVFSPITQDAKQHLQPDKWDYLDMYLYRIFLTNSSLFVLGAELIGILLGAQQSKVDAVCKFAAGYSLSLQIVNDNADFIFRVLGKEGELAKPLGKLPQDILNDIRNKIITLPLLFHLGPSKHDSNSQKLVRRILGATVQNKKYHLYPGLILEEMVNSKAMDRSINLGRKIAQNSVKFLNPDNPGISLLHNMLGVALWNKYYYSLKKFKQAFELSKGEKYLRREVSEYYVFYCDNGKFIPHTRPPKKEGSGQILKLF